MSQDDICHFRTVVIECVLATDLAKNMIWISTKHNMEMKLSRMQLVIKCADVGHPARNFDVHMKWSSRITEEFYTQGDLEQKQGIKISSLCDRSQPISLLPQSHLGFINFVSKPLFLMISQFCNEFEQPWIDNLEKNIAYWEQERDKYSKISIS